MKFFTTFVALRLPRRVPAVAPKKTSATGLASSFKLRAIALALIVFSFLPAATRAEHGRFDQTSVNSADEAVIFTPSGFEREGKVG
jgi:hypothetical protein